MYFSHRDPVLPNLVIHIHKIARDLKISKVAFHAQPRMEEAQFLFDPCAEAIAPKNRVFREKCEQLLPDIKSLESPRS